MKKLPRSIADISNLLCPSVENLRDNGLLINDGIYGKDVSFISIQIVKCMPSASVTCKSDLEI